jgi:hypothetical protein
MGIRFNVIPVANSNGASMTVYEIWDKPRFFGLVAERRFQLSSSEDVEPLCAHTFIVARTGEKLRRVRNQANLR